jgi:hypothetical protein
MCKSPLMSMLVFTVLALTSCSSEDGGSPAGLPADGNLQDMATCATEGFKVLGLAIETSLILFHELDRDSSYTAPGGFEYNDTTGEFGYSRVLGNNPTYPTLFIGIVEPLSTVEDGLQQGDIFTVSWWAAVATGRPEDRAAGSFRVIHNGLTSPPNQTETMRIIPAAVIWSGEEGGCRTEFVQFELVVHHLLDGEEVRSALTSFVCSNAEADTLSGYMTAGSGSDVGSISGTYDGTTYTCSVDLDTWFVDCSGN